MLSVITGYGPRVGSSFIMRQAKVRGMDVLGTKYMHGLAPVSGNPGGYYDLIDTEVLAAKAGVAKIWPRQFRYLRTPPDRMVVLGREDLDSWLASIDRQTEREGGGPTAEEVLEYTIPLMDRALDEYPGAVLKVTTESLNDRIDEILEFIGE